MIPQTDKAKGRPRDRSIPFAAGDEKVATATVIRKNKDLNKRRSLNTSKLASPVTQERMDVAVANPDSMVSRKIQEAFRDDVDAVKSLADIREVLIGPISRLHEARMEEVITILEEADRANRLSSRGLEERYDELARTCQGLLDASSEMTRTVQHLSSEMATELQRIEKNHDTKLAELFMMFDQKLQNLTVETTERVDGLEVRTGDDFQNLSRTLAGRIDDLAATTTATTDRIMARVEGHLAQADANAERHRAKQLEGFADTFVELADRVRALAGN